MINKLTVSIISQISLAPGGNLLCIDAAGVYLRVTTKNVTLVFQQLQFYR